MAIRYDRMVVVPFDDVDTSTRGVVTKAGLTVEAATDAGYGTVTGSGPQGGMTNSYASGGMMKTNVGTSRYMKLAIPSADQAALATTGRIQFEIKTDDFLDFVTGASRMFRFMDSAATEVMRIQTDHNASQAEGSGSADTYYRRYTNSITAAGLYGKKQYTRALALKLNTSCPTYGTLTFNPQVTLHDGNVDDNGGWMPVCLSWTPCWHDWYLNGVFMCRIPREIDGNGTIASIYVMEGEATKAGVCPIRNVLVMDTPIPHPSQRRSSHDVVVCGHSFTVNGDASSLFLPPQQGSSGAKIACLTSMSSTEACSLQGFIPTIRRLSAFDLNIFSVGYAAKTIAFMLESIDGSGTQTGFSSAGGTGSYGPNRTCTYSVAANVVTVTDTAHPFTTGDIVQFTNSATSTLNGTRTITKTGANSYTVPVTMADDAGPSATTVTPVVNKRTLAFAKPKIVVLTGHMNESNQATMASNITSINTALTALGIVPLWVNENNGDADGAHDHSTGSPSILSTIPSQVAADILSLSKYIGLVDFSAVAGGSACNRDWIESATAKIHWNWVGSSTCGALVAREIDSILASPPSYAWWA